MSTPTARVELQAAVRRDADREQLLRALLAERFGTLVTARSAARSHRPERKP